MSKCIDASGLGVGSLHACISVHLSNVLNTDLLSRANVAAD